LVSLMSSLLWEWLAHRCHNESQKRVISVQNTVKMFIRPWAIIT